MKNVAIITDVDFWEQGSGHRARIAALADYLSVHVNLYILYVGKNDSRYELLKTHQLAHRIFCIPTFETFSATTFRNRVHAFFYLVRFDVCIIEWIHNSFFLHLIPYRVTAILDTHDIAHRREESFQAFKTRTSHMSQPDEYALYHQYDYVALICDDDFEDVKSGMREDRLILLPHSPVFRKRTIREEVRTIGFIGSDYAPNEDALRHFLDTVWGRFEDNPRVSLHVYGKVVRGMRGKYTNVQKVGYVPDLDTIYDEMDISVNMVRFGAGAKIKNIEALANAIPLVTSSHGARGLEKGIGDALKVADAPHLFALELERLIGDFQYRKDTSDAGYAFARNFFSPEVCYTPLVTVINN